MEKGEGETKIGFNEKKLRDMDKEKEFREIRRETSGQVNPHKKSGEAKGEENKSK